MKKWYDSEEDVLNIQLSAKDYWKSVELDGIVIDVAEDGSLLSIEVHRASKVFSGKIKRVLETARLVVKK
ncbi:DUF2283 domain-containing protein [archaeon]|nr:DUF2283 domain-containing protein [archaeon]